MEPSMPIKNLYFKHLLFKGLGFLILFLCCKGILHPKTNIFINHLTCRSKLVKALFVFVRKLKILLMKTGRIVTAK